VLAAGLLLCGAQAQADLYRWVDPQSGTVKFSNEPPPWYGRPELERRAPEVERIPARQGGVAPAPKPPATPATPAAPQAKAPPAAPEASPPALEAQRKLLLAQIAEALEPGKRERNPDDLRRRLEAFAAVAAALDRADPEGAAARRAEAQALLGKPGAAPK